MAVLAKGLEGFCFLTQTHGEKNCDHKQVQIKQNEAVKLYLS